MEGRRWKEGRKEGSKERKGKTKGGRAMKEDEKQEGRR